jgi:hypothetical protein
MDRLKADFIASLPMQPDWAAPVIVLNAPRDEGFGLVVVGSDRKMLSHSSQERSARRGALAGGKRLRRNFFGRSDWDKFKLSRAAVRHQFG